MAFRFRKSFKIAPGVRLNLGKSGLGISAGVKGLRVGSNSRGTYTSVGIPGTGISSISYSSSRKRGSSNPSNFQEIVPPSRTIKTKTSTGLGWLIFFAAILFFINRYIGILTVIAIAVLYVINSKEPIYQAKRDLRTAKRAYQAGDYATAADKFKCSYTFFSEDKAIALMAASSYAQTGQYDQAIICVSDYLSYAPEDYGILKMVAYWYKELGEKDKALSTFQELPSELTNDSKTLLLMSELLTEKGLMSGAIEVLRRAPLRKRNLTPDLIEILYALGLLYEKIGDQKRAKSSFERVYSYDATFKEVTEKVGFNP